MRRIIRSIMLAIALVAAVSTTSPEVRADDPPTQQEIDAMYLNGQNSAFLDAISVIQEAYNNNASNYDIASHFQGMADTNAMQATLFGNYGYILAQTYFTARADLFQGFANLYFSL